MAYTGTWGDYLYRPNYGVHGTEEWGEFDAGLMSADVELIALHNHRALTADFHGLTCSGEGHGKGLDADTLDGMEGTSILTYVYDHGGLSGLLDNDHPQYALSGKVWDHGTSLSGLGDDDHTLYIKADGTRAFSGTMSGTSGYFSATVSGQTPTLSNHLATKGYVDSSGGSTVRIITEVLSPEFPGAVIWDPSTVASGHMTASYEVDGDYKFNYYEFYSDEPTGEALWVMVRWRIPDNFLGWDTAANQALNIDIKTEGEAADGQLFTLYLYNESITWTFANGGPAASTVSGDWYSYRDGNSLIYLDATNAVMASSTSGDMLVFGCQFYSTGPYVRVGDITLRFSG